MFILYFSLNNGDDIMLRHTDYRKALEAARLLYDRFSRHFKVDIKIIDIRDLKHE